MFEFFKNIKLKYFIFFGFISLLTLGIQWPNVTVNFYFTALWEVFFVPSIIITFWDDFMRVFPSTSTEPPKIKKPIMITIIILLYTVMFNPSMFYYIADTPSVMNKSFNIVEGKVSYVKIKSGIRKKQIFEINGRIFSAYASDFISVEKDKNYKVTMLKNSKFIFGIEPISGLSLEEKISDFNFLFEFIKKNYPYLDVNKRLNGIDWIKNKEKYLEKIKNTKTDTEFFYVLNEILKELNNDHTNMIDRDFFVNLLIPLDKIIKSKPELKNTWLNLTLEKIKNSKVLKRYEVEDWDFKSKYNEKTNIMQPIKNVSITDIVDNKIAYIKIPRMINDLEMDEDKKILNDYLPKIKNYKALVIDIRGNGGGSSYYWTHYLVPKITSKSFVYKTNIFIREGEIIQNIKNYYKKFNSKELVNFKTFDNLDKNSMPKLPEEIFSNFKYYVEDKQNITPLKDSINFKGNIYLLVDRGSFSSSDGFANFSKNSGFATLIGEKTGGDGISSDPWIETLPNSNFLFRIAKEMGTTEEGTCNFEHKTSPDIYIDNPQSAGFFMDDKCILKVLDLEKLKF